MSWNKEWTKNLDISVYEPYPLQFANVERIEKNDAIYIFDETGCGKTISAGLMALHYLYNNPEKNVLVITVPQLVSSNQFIEEWYGGERKPAKLPFKSCGIKRERIEIINYDYRNIANCSGKWGLIIIDEAHYFLEAEKRIDAIKNLRAEKIIFMTATPIKKSSDDLEKYSKLADIILNKDVSRDWIKRLLCNDEQGQDFICSSFDYDSPVTRYFKDTVNALALEYNLTNKEASNGKAGKKAPIREVVLLPYKENGEIEEIANYIADNRKKETEEEIQIDYERKIVLKKNRFVIFTRFIDKEARALETFLKNDDRFIGFHNDNPENKITYIRIDGTEDTDNIDKYTNNGFDKEYNEKDLPEVIIITYQIAEAGVNLPGYNYIINYHIPAFPSSLEQRFGRVDRLGKQNGSATLHKKIYMVYPLNPSPLEPDTYKTNYYIANWMFRKMMINYLPAKNTILSPEILNNLVDNKDKLVEKLERFETLCNKDGRLEKVCSELNRLSDTKTENIESDQEWDDDICDLIDYCDKKGIYPDEGNSVPQFKNDLLEKIEQDIIESQKASLSESFAKQLEKIGSKIFIGNINDNSNWNLIDAVEEDVETEAGNKLKGCYERIKDLEGYKKYCENFKLQIKEPLEKARIDKILFVTRGGAKNWRIVDQISNYIFDLFIDNKDIDSIILSEDQEYVKDVLKGFDFIEGLKLESREEEKALLLKYPRYVIEKTWFHRFFIRCIEKVYEYGDRKDIYVPSEALGEAFNKAFNEYYTSNQHEQVSDFKPDKFEFVEKDNIFSITNQMKLFCYCNNLELYRACYKLYREYGNFLKLCVSGQEKNLSEKYNEIKSIVTEVNKIIKENRHNIGAILFTALDVSNPHMVFLGAGDEMEYPWRMVYKGTIQYTLHSKILPFRNNHNVSFDWLQNKIDNGIENDSKKLDLDFGTTMFFSEIVKFFLEEASTHYAMNETYKIGSLLIARNISKVVYNKAFNDNCKLRNVLEQYDISDYIERESNKK